MLHDALEYTPFFLSIYLNNPDGCLYFPQALLNDSNCHLYVYSIALHTIFLCKGMASTVKGKYQPETPYFGVFSEETFRIFE